MKQAVTAFILALILPAVCFGYAEVNPCVEPIMFRTAGWEGYLLDTVRFRQDGSSSRLKYDLVLSIEDGRAASRSLRSVDAGLPCDLRPAPENKISMISFLWAEMFGGVDVVAEAKELAWQMRLKKGRHGTLRSKREDRRSRWNLEIACRVDDQMELAARFDSRGRLFGEDSMTLQFKAQDARTNEVGLIMSYVDGGLSLKADNVSLADAAEVKLVVKF